VNELGRSRALGFWDKHLLAMDEMYALHPAEPDEHSEQELPSELLAIWNGPERELIGRVFDQAERDGQALVRACVEDAVSWFSQRSSQIRGESASTRDPLTARAKLRPKRGEYRIGDLWLTVVLGNSSAGDALTLYANLWSKGGRRAGAALAAAMIDATEGSKMPLDDDWHSGSAVFFTFNLNQSVGQDPLEIDLDGVRAAFSACLKKQDHEALSRIHQAARSL
jgi:hypothetical protein